MSKLKVIKLTLSRFKNWRRLHLIIAFEQLRASITNVTVKYDVNARKMTRTDERIHPVFAKADGSSKLPVPTIKLKTKTNPTCDGKK